MVLQSVGGLTVQSSVIDLGSKSGQWLMETGYILRQQICSEKKFEQETPEVGLGARVVLDLTAGYQDKNYILVTDNFYTSPILAHKLLARGIDCLGTVKANNKHFPKDLIFPQKPKPARGSGSWRSCQKILAVSWSELEEALKKIDSKFRLLEFTRDDIPRIQEKKDLKATERLQKTLEKQIDSVPEQMMEIQALKIEKGEEPDHVRKWSLEIEKQVAEYEEITQDVRKTVKNLREEASQEVKWEEEKAEEEKRQWRYEEELKLEEAKMQIERF
ncbi:hypothetical protein AWC38_SpisGene2141 [Stylophora pistillata]|uniref:PiggyBac transposable element-derived protein domain-containing protein n=1 Tax=Stylophora pistillata TaxID=50429 RepID=A0A2B4SVW6_STYPI|nr:hypothetical protein AWC38_SpisGene2141 [Stylophora pistillata]